MWQGPPNRHCLLICMCVCTVFYKTVMFFDVKPEFEKCSMSDKCSGVKSTIRPFEMWWIRSIKEYKILKYLKIVQHLENVNVTKYHLKVFVFVFFSGVQGVTSSWGRRDSGGWQKLFSVQLVLGFFKGTTWNFYYYLTLGRKLIIINNKDTILYILDFVLFFL